MKSQRQDMGPVHAFLTKLTLKTAIVVFTGCSFLKGFPFALESTDCLRVRKYTAKWKIALWHMSNWIFYFAATFQFTTYMYALTTDVRGNGFAIHTIYVMYSLFGVVFMLSVYMKPDVCILMMNQHDRLLQKIEELGVDIPPWSSQPFVILCLNYMAYAMANGWLVISFSFPFFPNAPCYLYSYLPKEIQTLPVFIGCMVYETSWIAPGLSTVTAFFCYWCADIFTINCCLSALLKKNSWTENDMKLYRALQVFCNTFNEFNGSFFTVGFTVALVILPIVYIYIALTFTGLHILVFLVFPALAIFNVVLICSFLPQHSKVWTLSDELVVAMKRGARTAKGNALSENESTVMYAREELVKKKRMASFAPMGIRIWFFGVYTLGTTQELMDQLFNNILLLMSL